MRKGSRSFIALTVLVGSVLLSAQQPPLLDQTDVQVIINFCMSPTGEKVMQPPEPGMDRTLWCGGIPLGPGMVLAGFVRNVQVLENHSGRLAAVEATLVQIQADLGAIQTQLINNTARITALEAAPLNLQGQIDALVANVARVKAALQ